MSFQPLMDMPTSAALSLADLATEAVSVPEEQLSPLQAKIVRQLIALAQADGLRAGDHLAESPLAQRLGVSRSPVNVALRHLVKTGAASYDANRGYFLARDAGALSDMAEELEDAGDALLLRIAEDRRTGGLPMSVTEADLMRRYGASRHAVRRVLARIQQEGWIERRLGHGWDFQPMIDSVEAYEESYAFRLAVEPAALLSGSFRADRAELEALRLDQKSVAERDGVTAMELFEANRRFHETLAKWSHNRFVLQAVRQMDALRRLAEYAELREGDARREQMHEHLRILDAIAAGDALTAATLMREHLDGARRRKLRHAARFGGAEAEPASNVVSLRVAV